MTMATLSLGETLETLTDTEITAAVAKREALTKDLVGLLYPAILAGEVETLQRWRAAAVTARHQVFRFTPFDGGAERAWDVTMALELRASPNMVEGMGCMGRAELAGITARNVWTAEHLPAVNPDEPGLAVPDADTGTWILIDGTHRAVRAYVDGRDGFDVYLLTPEAGALCRLY